MSNACQGAGAVLGWGPRVGESHATRTANPVQA